MPVPTIALPDGRSVRLGRLRPAALPSCLRFAVYLDRVAAMPPPANVDYAMKAAASLAQMDKNDVLGCCVIAGKMHQIGLWTGNESGTPALASDNEVVSQYVSICGPGDLGCNIAQVLDYFKSNGLVCGGRIHKIDGYVSVDNGNQLEVQVAVFLLGSLTLGINLPAVWHSSARPGFVWGNTSSPSIGGHDVCVVGYNAQGVQVATWGMVGTITWMALSNKSIVEECYAALAPDWYANANFAPCGVDAQSLRDDLAKLGGGVIPPLPAPPGPMPPPVPPIPPPVHVPPTAARVKTVVDAAVLAGLRATLRHFGNRLAVPAMVLGAALPVVNEDVNQAIDAAFAP